MQYRMHVNTTLIMTAWSHCAGAAKKSRVLSMKEKKVIAYHEAGHALVGWLMQHTDLLLRVSIVQRTNATLGFAQYSPKDKLLHSKDEVSI